MSSTLVSIAMIVGEIGFLLTIVKVVNNPWQLLLRSMIFRAFVITEFSFDGKHLTHSSRFTRHKLRIKITHFIDSLLN